MAEEIPETTQTARGVAAEGKKEKFFPPKELKRAFLLSERADKFSQTLETLLRPQNELGTEPVSVDTLGELKRIKQATENQLQTFIGQMSPEQQGEFRTLKEIRTGLEEAAERKFAEVLKQEETAGDGEFPEEIKKALKLEDDGHILQFAYNHTRRPMEDLGTTPISREAAKEIDRVVSSFLQERNTLFFGLDEEQQTRLRTLRDHKWALRRRAYSDFDKTFEEETGEPFVPRLKRPKVEVPIPEPKEKRRLVSRECPNCGVKFTSSIAEGDCYDCTLEAIIRDMPPEEGDFNTAKIVSGTLTPEEEKYLRTDLEGVETGTSQGY